MTLYDENLDISFNSTHSLIFYSFVMLTNSNKTGFFFDT